MYNIVFVIGGPGVGKGTQCSLLVKEWPTKLVHLSLGDILRDERDKPSSKWGDTLQKNLKEGLIGSKEMVVELLQGKLEGLSAQDKQKVILLDGEYIMPKARNEQLTGVQVSQGRLTDVCSSRNASANQLAAWYWKRPPRFSSSG